MTSKPREILMTFQTRDTYFGGPLHSDLTVDGLVDRHYRRNVR